MSLDKHNHITVSTDYELSICLVAVAAQQFCFGFEDKATVSELKLKTAPVEVGESLALYCSRGAGEHAQACHIVVPQSHSKDTRKTTSCAR